MLSGPLRPHALAARLGSQLAVAVLLIGVNVALLSTDLVSGRGESLGALSFLSVLAAGWLLAPATAGVVAASAVALRIVAVALGDIGVRTGVAQSLVLAVAAVVGWAVAEAAERSRSTTAGLQSELEEAEAEERRRGQELALMQMAARTLASANSLDGVLREVVTIAAAMATNDAGHPRHAAALRIEGDRAVSLVEYDATLGLSAPGREFPVSSHPGLQHVLRTGQPFCGDLDAAAYPLATAQALRATGARAVVICAVRSGGSVDAVLSVSARDEQGFTPAQVQRLSALANLAGLAIGSAERLEMVRSDAERAASLERAKSDFLRLASHELRGPIAVIGGYVDMLSAGAFGPVDQADVTRPLPILQDKVEEMNDLIEQMLEMARLEDSRLELQLEPADMRELLGAAMHHAQGRAGPRHRVVVELGDEPAPVTADVRRVGRILGNLVDNAVKYSPAGGEVRGEVHVDDAGRQVLVSVHDQGLGIEPQQRERLFTMFGRLVTAETSHIPGTGLGLYLSQKLAGLHGGAITVESTPGKGSTFTLALPLAERMVDLRGARGGPLEETAPA